VGIDQVHAVGPAGVRALGGVAEFVEDGGNLDAEFAHAGTGHEGALFFIFGAGKDDLVADVVFHLPDVAGMGFGDVDDQELHAVFVLVVELGEGGHLPPEGRSSVAAEDQRHGLLLVERGKLDVGGFVQFRKVEVGRGVADVQMTGAGTEPESFEGKEQEGHGTGHPRHDFAELFRGLVHRPPDIAADGEVDDRQADGDAEEDCLCLRGQVWTHGFHLAMNDQNA
jgi:hypothetical protein